MMTSANSPTSKPLKARIRLATESDIPAVQEIYAYYVRHTSASFEEEPPTVAEMLARFQRIRAKGLPYLVALKGKQIVGYAYAGPFRDRSAYRYTCEDSVYIARDFLGRNLGNALVAELIKRCTVLGFRQMIAVIGDSANAASIALHSRHGFAVIGALRAAGFKFGQWADAVLMQRPLGDGNNSLPPGEPGKRKRPRKR